MRFNKQIAALMGTALVTTALTAGMMTPAPSSDRRRRSTIPIGRYGLPRSIGPKDTRRQTQTYSLITS